MMSKWITNKPPPKDNDFIADIGLPFSVCAIYNEVQDEFIYCTVGMKMINGQWNDSCFKQEYAQHNEILAWMEMPSPIK